MASDLPAPDMGADEGRDVGESSIQVQGRSERESGMKKQEGFVAPKASSWVDVAQEKKDMGEKVNPKEGYVEQTGIMEKIVVRNTEEEIEEGGVIENDIDDNGDLVKEVEEIDKEDPLKAHEMPELNGEEADHDKSETEDGEARQDTETDDGSTIPEVAMPQEKPAELNMKEHEHEKSETENGNEGNIMEMRKGENQIFSGSVIGGNSNLRPSLPRRRALGSLY
ncbi:hypothetical protein F2Q69_00044045 [Brassica cretica]|uniref:Uncharacterized protein n=1 Tax=Brassica cretica TaxID=69181 RepID=A0A8S9N646_BRACR|nr:hypothetical protein F2Q69_00044045 [Brassica cretica]